MFSRRHLSNQEPNMNDLVADDALLEKLFSMITSIMHYVTSYNSVQKIRNPVKMYRKTDSRTENVRAGSHAVSGKCIYMYVGSNRDTFRLGLICFGFRWPLFGVRELLVSVTFVKLIIFLCICT